MNSEKKEEIIELTENIVEKTKEEGVEKKKEIKVNPLHIILYPDKHLKEMSKPVTNYSSKLKELLEYMIDKMKKMGADGLAAVQVGHLKRMFVMKINDKPQVFVNPKIVDYDGKTISSQEGCLSIPGVVANLNCRNDEIYIEAKDVDGKELAMILTDNEAITFQHELDHLNGIILFDKMKPVQKRMKIKKNKKFMKKMESYFEKYGRYI